MSQSGYEKLKHTPAEGRSLADEVRLIMHEGMMQLKEEKEASQQAEEVCIPSNPAFMCTNCQVFQGTCNARCYLSERIGLSRRQSTVLLGRGDISLYTLGVQFSRFYTHRALFLREYAPYTGKTCLLYTSPSPRD